MNKKILFTALIGIMVMLQGISFGAELTIYGSGGVIINSKTGDITICPNLSSDVCAILKVEGTEIEIITGDIQSNYNGEGISGTITTSDGRVLNVTVNQGNISCGSSNDYVLNDFNIKVINQ